MATIGHEDRAPGRRRVAGAGVAAAEHAGPVAGADQAVGCARTGGSPRDGCAGCRCPRLARSPRARCAATWQRCGVSSRRRRPSCTVACFPCRRWRSTSASHGLTSPGHRTRSSTWWRCCRTRMAISPRRTPSRSSSRCSTVSNRRCAISGRVERVVVDNASLAVKDVLTGRVARDRQQTDAFEPFRCVYPLRAEFCAPSNAASITVCASARS